MGYAAVKAAIKAVFIAEFGGGTPPATEDAIADGMADAIATVAGLSIPSGGIIMANLSGTSVTADFTGGLGDTGTDWEGWAICNGSNGTPNLTDKFVRSKVTGAGGTGGSDTNSHTHTSAAHTHPLSANGGASIWVQTGGAMRITTATGPSFTHTNAVALGATGSFGGTDPSIPLVGDTDSATPGVTGTPSDTDNKPAYFELVFLMKV